MYDRMVREHGYSIRKLAEKLGKDKGYLENRLRLADAPEEIRELVSVRKDTAVPRVRAPEGHGREEAPATRGPGCQRRAVARQAPREDRRAPARRRPTRTGPEVDELPIEIGGRPRTGHRDDARWPEAGWTGQRRNERLEPQRRLARPGPASPRGRGRGARRASSGRRTSFGRSRRSTGRTSRST